MQPRAIQSDVGPLQTTHQQPERGFILSIKAAKKIKPKRQLLNCPNEEGKFVALTENDYFVCGTVKPTTGTVTRWQ